MRSDLELLREALSKQSELRNSDSWADEILELSPPILWFGDSDNSEKVVTVGANPSRREFLDSRNGRYMQASKQRFHHLETADIHEVLRDERALREIVESYNRYFHQNPYRSWFGKPHGSKVEGFLNGLGASLYGLKPMGAVHTDLIPFATMSDFRNLNEYALKEDLFNNNWASNLFEKLMDFLNPSIIIVFGSRNSKYFDRYYQRIVLDKSFTVEKRAAKYGISNYTLKHRTIPLVGFNLYLGNPYGFTREMLNEFGSFIRSKIKS